MCISSVGQIVYGVVMLACTVLTAVALFTPGWTQVEGTPRGDVFSKGEGIMPWTCAKLHQSDACNEWWSSIPNWQHIVIVCMWMALIVELFCLVWNLLVFFTCCFKSCLIHPIMLGAAIASILLFISVIVYGVNGKEFVIYQTPKTHEPGQLGYSFWLAVGALICAVADTILGFITVCFGEMCC